MDTEQIHAGLARFLSEHWGTTVTVSPRTIASAGARRLNVLFDATRNGETLGLVATINPSEAMQLMEIEVEAACVQLAEAAGMPVAHVYAVCTDRSFVGGPFFVSSLVEGVSIGRQVLRLVEAEGIGEELGRQCGAALARLHAVDIARAPEGLERPGPGQTPAEWTLEEIAEDISELVQPSPTFTLAYRWLERNAPPSARQSIIHRDFRNGNIIVGEDGLRAVLDWEISRIGDPMEDLAWLCQRAWRFRNDTIEVGGFASRKALRDGYESAGGQWNDASFYWWKVLGALRWGLGLAGQMHQHLDGSVPSVIMAASGRRIAELEYDLLMLLKHEFAGDH